MRRALFLLAALPTVALALAAAALAEPGVTATPVSRLPFPERGYVVDLPGDLDLDTSRVQVTENGAAVRRLTVTPLSASGLRTGVVLAIDASESMAGAPFAAALAAVREFARRGPGGEIGLVAFNGQVKVLRRPVGGQASVQAAISNPPRLAYGTRIYDAVDRSVALLRTAKLASGSVVVLSDGADVGSKEGLNAVVATAARHHIRVFTVGLRSGAYDARALQTLAARTGGAYAEATTSRELARIYAALGRRFAREYLVQYRSDAPAKSSVQVRIAIDSVGTVNATYTAPTPAGVAPYHRSVLTRFLLSPGSVFVLALVLAALVAWLVRAIILGPKSTVVERIAEFSKEGLTPSTTEHDVAARRSRRPRSRSGLWARLEHDLEIARIEHSPQTVVGWTVAATVLLVAVLVVAVSPIVALLGLLTPLGTRAAVARKLRQVRGQFADELPTNLQVLASALRAGHSFSGALGVVVENAHEPARSELRRILQDDQFGVPPEEAIRRVAERMQNRDLEQVALLAELQRTAGGNSAEVLDTVVATIRQRGELRRLVRTLTAQGRMARWILTALPIGLTIFLWLIRPDIMRVLVESGGGQIALVIATLMVVAGSFVIQRIVDIDV